MEIELSNWVDGCEIFSNVGCIVAILQILYGENLILNLKGNLLSIIPSGYLLILEKQNKIMKELQKHLFKEVNFKNLKKKLIIQFLTTRSI